LNFPICVFITRDLAFYATVVGKEGMDKAHCHWCKLSSAQWQTYEHAPGPKWTIEEHKQVAGTIKPLKRNKNGVKSYPQLDCVELKRYIFPVLYVMLGLANQLIKHTIDYANLVVERRSEVLKRATILQIEAAHKYAAIKQEIADWGICKGPTFANMHLTQGHLNEQIKVEGELTKAEREVAIMDAGSLKMEVMKFKKELSVLKNKKTELSQQNTASKVEVTRVERETGRYSKHIWQGLERILARDWKFK
jgi:hypothetical protein